MILRRKGTEHHMNEKYMIAIDGGGTKTEFVLFTEDGTVLEKLILGGTNPNITTPETAAECLAVGIAELLTRNRKVCRIYAGIAGALSGNNGAILQNALQNRYPDISVTVVSDIMNVIGMAENTDRCIAAIIGTGSVVFGWDGETLQRAGGWGYRFDGAGSGYDIGRDVLSCLLAVQDGLLPRCKTAEFAEEKLGGAVFDHITELYSAGQDYIASYAPIAFAAAEAGDAVAEEILARSADRVAALITHIHKQGCYGDRVVLSGGIAIHFPQFAALLKERLDSRITLDTPTVPPVFGAMRMCAQAEGIAVSLPCFRNTFRTSCRDL